MVKVSTGKSVRLQHSSEQQFSKPTAAVDLVVSSNVYFKMRKDENTQKQGAFIENGSTGIISNLTFDGYGFGVYSASILSDSYEKRLLWSYIRQSAMYGTQCAVHKLQGCSHP